MQTANKIPFHASDIMQEAFNSYGDGVLIVNHKTNRTFNYNKKLCELFFLTPEEQKGDDQFKNILGKIKNPELFTLILKQIEKLPYKEVEGEMRLVKNDDTNIIIEFQSTPVIKQHEGMDVIIGRVWYFKDITKLKEHELRLIESSKMAALGEMAAGIAHEINNPLTIIKNYVTKLKKVIYLSGTSPLTQEIDKYLSVLEKANKRMIKTIYGLKAISRNDHDDAFTYFSIKTMLSELEEICRERAGKYKIAININNDLDGNHLLLGHKAQLLQVFINLVNNAIDAIEESQQIENSFIQLDLRVIEKELVIEVRDTGPGIPDNIVAKVFNPFFSTKKAGKGTGLGLSLSKKILEDHGASITYTHPTQGLSTFIIKFANWKSGV